MVCSKCKIDKGEDCFPPSWFKRGRGYCHPCHANRDKQDRLNKPKYYIWKRAKANAEHRGIEFNLTRKDIPEIPDFCPVFPWLRLEYTVGEGTKKPNAASIDRIENAKGYVVGNIRIISSRANTLKSDATSEELRALLADSYTQGEL